VKIQNNTNQKGFRYKEKCGGTPCVVAKDFIAAGIKYSGRKGKQDFGHRLR